MHEIPFQGHKTIVVQADEEYKVQLNEEENDLIPPIDDGDTVVTAEHVVNNEDAYSDFLDTYSKLTQLGLRVIIPISVTLRLIPSQANNVQDIEWRHKKH